MQLHQAADAAVGCGQAELAFGFQMNLLAGWRAEGGHGLQTFAEGRGEGLGIYFTFTIAAGTVGFHLLTSSSEKRLTWQGENGRKEIMELEFKELVGKTLESVCGKVGDDRIEFRTTDGKEYIMFHSQDCCESVHVEDISGEISDLLGSPILQAEESSNDTGPEGYKYDYQPESMTWTFYRIATTKGQVVIRWLGTSNGYYSERVTFAEN